MLQERRSKLVDSRGMMSTVTPIVTRQPAAGKSGAELKTARERLGLSLQDVATSLRIRLPHLEALEEGRISELPGNAYALAFVRTYSASLGLDAREMVRRFKTEAAAVSHRTELVFPIPMPERGMPPGAILLLGLVMAVGVYSGWYRLSGEGRLPAETVTAVPERLASLAEQALPPAPSPPRVREAANLPPRPVTVEPAPLADKAAPELPADPAPPAVAISPSSAAAAQLPPRPTDASPGPAAVTDGGRILLRATADAWLLVKERSGAILLSRTMKAGESWPVPVRLDLLLTTGNAGGTEIVVDGLAAPSLGGNGAVRRDLPLDPDQIKEGKLAGAVMQQAASTRARQ